MEHRYEFDSFEAFAHHCANAPRAGGYTFDSDQRGSADDSWSKTRNFAHAAELARDGIHVDLIPVELPHMQHSRRFEIFHDVAGEEADIGRYLHGDPENMIEFHEQEQKGTRFVRVGVNISAAANVAAATIQRRGKAVLSLIDALEEHGKRCEIIVCFAARHSGDHNQTLLKVTVKEFAQPVDMARLAYCLTHPSMLRRHYFRFIEALPHARAHGAPGCYGNPIQWPHAEEFDITTPHMQGHEFKSDESAARWVEEQIAKIEEDKNTQ